MTSTPEPTAEPIQTGLLPSVRRVFWQAVLIAHVTLAVLWWWRQPSGFAVSDPHFWVNTVLPWVVVIAMLMARFPKGRWAEVAQPYILAALPIIWIAAAIGARVVFPITFEWLWIAPFIVGLILAMVWVTQHRKRVRRPLEFVAIPAACIGAFLPVSQHARTPGTLPVNEFMPTMPANTETVRSPRDLQLSPDVRVNLSEGSIWHQSGPYGLGINPMLAFTSRSADGCWVLFALPRERLGPQRLLHSIQHDGANLGLLYADDDQSMLHVNASDDSRSVDVESYSRFPRTIWSHLNSFTEMVVTGHRRLFVSFSPCLDQKIEVMPMDYPAGRPERFAYLAEGGTFHIVEARSAEKGPFKALAAGTLVRGEPLGITLFDQDTPMFRITFTDFSAQASTNPSPTAGWGVPENAIEFRLEGNDPASPASIFLTLASTSVGSGYDSVGHSGGTYRNRMRIERLIPPPTPLNQ